MFPYVGEIVVTSMDIVTGNDFAACFNYFFTLVFTVGMIGWGIGLLCQIISRS